MPFEHKHVYQIEEKQEILRVLLAWFGVVRGTCYVGYGVRLTSFKLHRHHQLIKCLHFNQRCDVLWFFTPVFYWPPMAWSWIHDEMATAHTWGSPSPIHIHVHVRASSWSVVVYYGIRTCVCTRVSVYLCLYSLPCNSRGFITLLAPNYSLPPGPKRISGFYDDFLFPNPKAKSPSIDIVF